MLGKVLCVLGGVVLGYVAREEISEVVENVMETFSEQSVARHVKMTHQNGK